MTDQPHHAELRAWAKGIYPSEAAVELLIRFADGRFAGLHHEWIQSSDWGTLYVDWAQVQLASVNSPFSGGERRILAIAASLGSSECTVNLNNATAGLGPHNAALVLAAISHALGSHEFRPEPIVEWSEPGVVETDDGVRVRQPEPEIVGWTTPSGALFPWPEEG